MPGCVVAIGRHGKIAFFKAYGKRQLEPSPKDMTTDTLFDMASVTKPVATATSIALLVERGKLSYDDPVAKYLPDFAAKGKDKVTIRQLLLHQGGLIADNAISDYDDGPARAWKRIFALPLQYTPGEDFAYSDVGYIVLGKVVEAASGEKLDLFARENIYAPLGMTETGYLPARRPSPPRRADRAPRRSLDARRGPRSAGLRAGRRCRPRGAFLHCRRPGRIRPNAAGPR